MIEQLLENAELNENGVSHRPQAVLKRASIVFVVVFALWTAFGLLSSVHFFFQRGADARFGETASHVVVFYWGWAILTPGVILLTNRLINAPGSAWLRSGMLALLGLAVVVAHGVLHPLLIRMMGVDSQASIDLPGLQSFAVRHGGGDLATFAVLVGGCLLFNASRRERKRALASTALEGQLARAELEILRWQLHPHFLFNALNTVSTLVLKGDQESADRAIGLISNYLRHALAQRPDSMVSLREELETVDRYVDVERLRFGDTLEIRESVEATALDGRVPGLILQPLVENAIRHGVGRGAEGGSISITAAIDHGRLCIGVTNPRNDFDGHDSTQFGLRYVRERLQQFYGAGASFELVLGTSESTAALDLPFVMNGEAAS
ncbi:MAG: histidine kinase [Gemmatimonadota bacterium]|nr:histidine kinase [Gemmatimonadota bacterium]